MENMSLSDIAAVTKDNDNWGGAGWLDLDYCSFPIYVW